MELTPSQKDALTEIINIGFGKAASTLSTLTGKRVKLNVPDLYLLSPDEVETVLADIAAEDSTTVQQVFSGNVSGSTLLVLNQDSASILIDLVSGGTGEKRRLMNSDREAIEEIGNILLNSYIGSFGNILKINIRFTIPRIQNETISDVMNLLPIDQIPVTTVLLVKTEFVVEHGQISGYVLIIMGIESFETLLNAIDKMIG